MSQARRWAPLLLVLAAVLVVAALTGRQAPGDGPPLDPRSTGPVGTAALVETLRLLGADVQVSADLPGSPEVVAVLLADGLGPAQHDELMAWTRAGGTLVVADPRSPLAAAVTDSAGGFLPGATLRPDCDADVLTGIVAVEAPGAVPLSAPPGALACFPRADGHWLVAVGQGRGTVVSLGGPEVWTNRRIGMADNAMLAAALLAPAPGAGVVVLEPARPGEGEAGLLDLLDPRVPAALLQAGLGFLLFVVWRARRLGPPLTEEPTVSIPSAELVLAAGHLYHQTRARARAGALLREDLRALLRQRLGLPPGVDDPTLVATAARVTGLDAEHLARTLGGPDPPDDRSLTELARAVEQLRDQGAARAPQS